MTQWIGSQHGEDALIASRFNHQPGYFVEVGALDGVTFSNTYMLEENYGWHGCLIEANPQAAAEAARRRPKSRVVAQAVTSPAEAGGELELHVVRGFEALSSMKLTRRTQNMIEDANVREGLRWQSNVETVSTTTLDDALSDAGAPKQIDFMSIDIEGHEWSALQGFSLGSKWAVEVLLIESNSIVPDLRIIAYLSRRRYAFVRTVGGINLWFERRPTIDVLIGIWRLLANRLLRAAKSLARYLLRKTRLLPMYRRWKGDVASTS